VVDRFYDPIAMLLRKVFGPRKPHKKLPVLTE
jgi:hypothetical protein